MKASHTACAIVAGIALAAGASLRAQAPVPQEQVVPLEVDPLLIVQARAVWEIIASDPNPVWPGWNAADTPLLIYLPGRQDVLINHPSPPEGFIPVRGLPGWPEARAHVRGGPTLIEWDGQNTTREIGGVTTLVIADTLSNRRQQMGGLLADARPAQEKLDQLEYQQLRADPYEQMALVVHEAFHAYQGRQAPGRAADELALQEYPCLSVENNVGVALEGQALADCLRAGSDADARSAALQFLALRAQRRAALSARALAYEDAVEFSEGLAKYTELALLAALEKRRPLPELWLAQGFNGFENLDDLRRRRVNQLLDMTAGNVNVNNDPYGASPVRMRLYYSGMAIAAALDRFDAGWKVRAFEPGSTLSGQLLGALSPTPEELQASLDRVGSGRRHELQVAKQELATKGSEDTQRLLGEATAGARLVLDHSALPEGPVGIAFTPFGIRRVDDDRTIYTLVPLQVALPQSAGGFQQARPRATLEDRSRRFFSFSLIEGVSAAELAQRLGVAGSGPWTVSNLDLELPGVRVTARRATIRVEGEAIVVQVLPPEPGAGAAGT